MTIQHSEPDDLALTKISREWLPCYEQGTTTASIVTGERPAVGQKFSHVRTPSCE